MLDIKWIRDNSDTLDTSLARRGVGPVAAELLDLDKRLRAVKTDLQLQQGRRKELSKKIGLDRAKGGEDQSLVDEVSAIKKKMTELEDEEQCLSERLQRSILVLPNIPHELVPEGRDESANVELRRWNTETNFDFEVKDHADLGIALGLMDFEQAAAMKIANVNNLKIGVISCTDNEPGWEATDDKMGARYIKIDPADHRYQILLQQIKQQRQLVDLMIISIHWGGN